jgi:7-keto-8-aminopelargonate synthetase-like enzyme
MRFIGDEDISSNGVADNKEANGRFKKLLLFSGNDYLGLSSHPTIARAVAKVLLKKKKSFYYLFFPCFDDIMI